MPEVKVRKRIVIVEEIFHESGEPVKVPVRRAAALAIVRNPYAGRIYRFSHLQTRLFNQSHNFSYRCLTHRKPSSPTISDAFNPPTRA